MRLKCYTAATMAEAMAMVRHELGDDAIIVSTQRAASGQGVRVTAALEEVATDDEVHQILTGSTPSPVVDLIRENLVYHGIPPRLIEQMIAAARRIDSVDPVMVCAGALDEVFTFDALPEFEARRPLMMIGPPGSGKTIAVAKLAARSRLAHRSVGVISADTVRAGALEQLQAFTRILEVDLRKVRGGGALADVLYEGGGQHDLVFIDTPGLNPFVEQDVAFLRDLLRDVDVEPVLVMAAGGDPQEAAEMAEVFADLGATRLLATRLDMTRRLGAVLAAAEAGGFMISDVSINAQIVQGLCPITPLSMARLLVPQEERDGQDEGIATESARHDFVADEGVELSPDPYSSPSAGLVEAGLAGEGSSLDLPVGRMSPALLPEVAEPPLVVGGAVPVPYNQGGQNPAGRNSAGQSPVGQGPAGQSPAGQSPARAPLPASQRGQASPARAPAAPAVGGDAGPLAPGAVVGVAATGARPAAASPARNRQVLPGQAMQAYAAPLPPSARQPAAAQPAAPASAPARSLAQPAAGARGRVPTPAGEAVPRPQASAVPSSPRAPSRPPAAAPVDPRMQPDPRGLVQRPAGPPAGGDAPRGAVPARPAAGQPAGQGSRPGVPPVPASRQDGTPASVRQAVAAAREMIAGGAGQPVPSRSPVAPRQPVPSRAPSPGQPVAPPGGAARVPQPARPAPQASPGQPLPRRQPVAPPPPLPDEEDLPPPLEDFFQVEEGNFVEPPARESEPRPVFSYIDDFDVDGETAPGYGRKNEGR